MDQQLYEQAQQPGSNPLHELTVACREQALAALTSALVRPAALELADALEGEPMNRLREAAAEPLAALAEARKTLTKEKQSIHARLAAFHASARRKDPEDQENPPASDSPAVQALTAALTAAETAAAPIESKIRTLGYAIAALRATPEPDATVLAVLAEAMVGGHIVEGGHHAISD